MANSIITDAGLSLFSRAQAEGFTVPIDKMYIADVEGLDPSAVPSAGEGIPEGAMEYELDAVGRIEANCVVYSKVLGADEGNFYINWMGIYSSRHQTLVAVCYVPRHLKYKTVGFNAGNTLYKNFAIQFANASALTGITVPAETWQVNLDDRYALLNHGHAVGDVNGLQAALDGKLETSHNTDENAHPGTFVKCNGGGTVNGDLTLTGSVKAGYMESTGNIKTHKSLEADGDMVCNTAKMHRIWMDGVTDGGGNWVCDIYGRDIYGRNIGCFRAFRQPDGHSEVALIIYDLNGNNVGSISLYQGTDNLIHTWLSTCNGLPTEIARCDWVQSQIASRASGAPGYPNISSPPVLSFDTEYTASVSGWISIRLGTQNEKFKVCTLLLNGVEFVLGSSYGFYRHRDTSMFFPIKQGDVWKVTHEPGGVLIFLPNR